MHPHLIIDDWLILMWGLHPDTSLDASEEESDSFEREVLLPLGQKVLAGLVHLDLLWTGVSLNTYTTTSHILHYSLFSLVVWVAAWEEGELKFCSILIASVGAEASQQQKKHSWTGRKRKA